MKQPFFNRGLKLNFRKKNKNLDCFTKDLPTTVMKVLENYLLLHQDNYNNELIIDKFK